MKDCKWFEKFFSDYIDGQLDSKMLLELEDHLKDCPHCVEIIQRMKSISSRLQNLDQLKTSSDFETVLRTRIRVEMGLKRNSLLPGFNGFSLKAPVYAVSLAFFAAMILFISHKTSQQDSAEPLSPISISKNDSKLSNSKVVDQVRYELPVYHIYDHGHFDSDSNQTNADNYLRKTNPDSLRNLNDWRQPSKNQYPNRVQPASFNF
jgi:hypothetical protein